MLATLVTSSAIVLGSLIVSVIFNFYLFRYLEQNALDDMEGMLFLFVPIPFIGTLVLLARLFSHIRHEMKPETIAYRAKDKLFWEKVEADKKRSLEDAERRARGEYTPAEKKAMAEEAKTEKRWRKAQNNAMQKPRRRNV